jgi:hypothetical protein
MNLKWRQSLRGIRATALAGGIAVATVLSGCTVGPALYETSFTQYNDAVRKTLDEQMLANLVRMRYFQSPVFLQVSSLNASFSVGANAGLSGTFPSGGSNTGGLLSVAATRRVRRSRSRCRSRGNTTDGCWRHLALTRLRH